MKTKNKVIVGLLVAVSCLTLTCVNSFAYYDSNDDVLLSNNLMSASYYQVHNDNNYFTRNIESWTNTFLVLDFGNNSFNGNISIGLGADNDDIFNYDKYYQLNSTPQLVKFTYYNSIQGGYNDDDYNISEIRFQNALGDYERKNALYFNLFNAFLDNDNYFGYSGTDISLNINITQPYYIGCYMSLLNNKVYIEKPYMCIYDMGTDFYYQPKGKFYDLGHLPSEFINNSSYRQGYEKGKDESKTEINSLNNELQANVQTINSLTSQVTDLNEQLQNGVNWKTFAFAMADTPFKTISSMLGFEVLGVNLWKLFTAIVTILMIMWLLRKFR